MRSRSLLLAIALLSLAAFAAQAQILSPIVVGGHGTNGTSGPALVNVFQGLPSTDTQNPVSTGSFTYTAPNTIIVRAFACPDAGCSVNSATTAITTISDTAGSTFTPASGFAITPATSASVGGQVVSAASNVWIGHGGTSGSDVITVTCTNGSGTCTYLQVFGYQYSGIGSTAEIGAVSTCSTANSGCSNPLGITTSGNPSSLTEVIYAAALGAGTGITPGAGWTELTTGLSRSLEEWRTPPSTSAPVAATYSSGTPGTDFVIQYILGVH